MTDTLDRPAATTTWPEVDEVPRQMRAVVFREFGPPEVLHEETVDTPHPGPGEVLIKVGAVSVGRLLDLVARSGQHPYAKFTFPHILGADHAGTVVGLGEGVTTVAMGDRVAVYPVVITREDKYTRSGYADISPNVYIIGTHRQGADADYSVAPVSVVSKVPDGVDPAQAASLASVGAVAANQFARVGGVGPDSRVIVQGATSGLGATTALLARHLGAQVVVSSRHEAKRVRLRELGFAPVLDACDPTFPEQAREAFGGEGATVVIDNLGAQDVWDHGFDALEPGGAIATSGAFLGHRVSVNLQKLYSTGIRIVGVRTGTPESVAELWRQVALGFRTVVDRTFALSDAPLAHRYVEQADNVGRVVLLP